MITGRQIREGRKLAGYLPYLLAKRTKIMLATLHRAEEVDGEPTITLAQNAEIERVLQAAGVKFVLEDGGGAGARLRSPSAPDPTD